MHFTVRRWVLGGLAAAVSVVWLALVSAMLSADRIELPTAMELIGIWLVGCLAFAAIIYARRSTLARALNERVEGVAASHRALEQSLRDLASASATTESLVALVEPVPGHLRSVDARLTAIEESLAVLTRQTADAQRTDGVVQDVATAINELRQTELPDLRVDLRRFITATGINDYEQMVAWTELRHMLEVVAPMPALRGWAASPDVIRIVTREIIRGRPRLVVECGSGSSSVWLGYALRKVGGRLVSLEHDRGFAEQSRSMLDEHDLQDVVEIRTAPLADFGASSIEHGTHRVQPWYDRESVGDLNGIEILFIDGPPGDVAKYARYPAVPALLDRCAKDAMIVLDDAARPDEKAIVERWVAEYPDLQLEYSAPAEKGVAILRRGTLQTR
ncbi:class I SAM-dependent methyltransferase [Agromyces bauzanensis]